MHSTTYVHRVQGKLSKAPALGLYETPTTWFQGNRRLQSHAGNLVCCHQVQNINFQV